jgi:hypothetical protein
MLKLAYPCAVSMHVPETPHQYCRFKHLGFFLPFDTSRRTVIYLHRFRGTQKQKRAVTAKVLPVYLLL